MRLSLRVLGLDLLDLEVSTEDPKPPPRETDIGLAHVIPPEPQMTGLGFEDRKR